MSLPIPFSPPHLSVNRVRIVDLPGIPIDSQVRGRQAYELLSNRAIARFLVTVKMLSYMRRIMEGMETPVTGLI